jgi:hypothetical protein
VFYLHPWEIDPEQPKLQAGRLSRFRHYRNLAETETRLRQLLTDFTFDTVRRVVDEARANLRAEHTPSALPLPYTW